MNALDRLSPSQPEIERPLYAVSIHKGYFSSRSTMMLSVHRMDGMPEVDRFGEKLSTNRESWLTLPQAATLLSDLLGMLPQYGAASEAEERENLRRWNDEFGEDIAGANRKSR